MYKYNFLGTLNRRYPSLMEWHAQDQNTVYDIIYTHSKIQLTQEIEINTILSF